MSFITTAQLKDELASALKVPSAADLDAYWDAIITRAQVAAYQDIVGRLLKRGFTQGQIDAWDRGAEFQTAIGLYWAIVSGGLYAGYDQRVLAALDRRKELETVQVATNGIFIDPQTAPGTCGTGGPTTGGVFNFEDIRW